MKRWLWWALRLGIGLSLLWVVVERFEAGTSSVHVGTGAIVGLSGTILFLFAAQGLSALRWRVLLGAGAPPLPFLWRLYAVGAFFSLFLPTAVGGDAVRAAAAMRALSDRGAALVTVVTDRVLGVLALVIYAAIGVLLEPDLASRLLAAGEWRISGRSLVFAGAGVVAVAVSLGIVARRSARVRHATQAVTAALRRLAAAPGALLSAAILGLLVQAAYILAWAVLALGLRLPLPASALLFGVPVVSLATMLPVTLAGIGVREGAWALLFGLFALPQADGVAFSLLYFSGVIAVGALGGVVFVWHGIELDRTGESLS